MKIDLEQNSDLWISWRKTGIGGSDIGTILGLNPYKSCEQLWEEKTGLILPPDLSENMHVQRGQKLEPEARSYAQVMLDCIFEPACFQHDEFNFLLSSLDGISPCGKRALEIKCPSKKNHEMAIQGFLSVAYFAQCQHNILVSGAEEISFVSFNPKYENNFASIEIKPCAEFRYDIITYGSDFWLCVQEKRSPEILPIEMGLYINPVTGEIL